MEEKIKWSKCKKCEFLQHISHVRCVNCNNSEFENVEAGGNCKLLTYTILNAPPMEFRDKKSYALGVVEFSNGIKALGQLSIEENLEIGMELVPEYKKICDNLDGNEVYAYIFKPSDL